MHHLPRTLFDASGLRWFVATTANNPKWQIIYETMLPTQQMQWCGSVQACWKLCLEKSRIHKSKCEMEFDLSAHCNKYILWRTGWRCYRIGDGRGKEWQRHCLDKPGLHVGPSPYVSWNQVYAGEVIVENPNHELLLSSSIRLKWLDKALDIALAGWSGGTRSTMLLVQMPGLKTYHGNLFIFKAVSWQNTMFEHLHEIPGTSSESTGRVLGI